MGCCEEKLFKTEEDNSSKVIHFVPNVQQNSNDDQENNKPPANKKISLRYSRTNAEEFNLDNYIESTLKLHNELREKYNLPLLSKNEELNDMASKYAESLVNHKGKVINFSNIYKGQIVGENVIISESKRAEDTFNAISKEKNLYDFNENKFSKMTGHFTQTIWKETTDIGIGFWHDKINKKYYSVILYYPCGNCLGKFKKNINKEEKLKFI